MGVVTTVKRASAAGKRVTQSPGIDREEAGCVKNKLVLKSFNCDHGRTPPEMLAPTPSTLSLKTILPASSHDRKTHPENAYIAIATDADIDQDLFAELCCQDEMWTLHETLCGYRKAPILRHQHDSPGKLQLQDAGCCRNVELDGNMFIHAEDGLLFVQSVEILTVDEACVDSNHEATCETNGTAGR